VSRLRPCAGGDFGVRDGVDGIEARYDCGRVVMVTVYPFGDFPVCAELRVTVDGLIGAGILMPWRMAVGEERPPCLLDLALR
jgi:hypothetical protein